jgi:hypothetical protein
MSEGIPETTHYPTLALGHKHSSSKDLHIVGLELKIYGLEEIRDSTLPLAVVVGIPAVNQSAIINSLQTR